MTKNTMTKNVAGNVDEQSWTDAFEQSAVLICKKVRRRFAK